MASGPVELARSSRNSLVSIVMVHGENLRGGVFVGVHVDHPAEDDRVESAAGGMACRFRGDGTAKAELRPVGVAAIAFRGHAEICVQVPAGHA